MLSGRAGLPFPLQQALAWPGYLWLALLLYLALALLAGEAVRAVWLRVGEQSAGPEQAEGRVTGAGRSAARNNGQAEGTGQAGHHGQAQGTEQARHHGQAEGTGQAGHHGQAQGTEQARHHGRATRQGHATPQGHATTEAPVPGRPTPQRPPAASPSPAPAPSQTPTLLPPGHSALPPLPVPSRRLFVSRTVAAGASLAATAAVGYGAATTFRGPTVKRVTVPLAKLPRAAHGFRIAVVSDIHLGPVLGRAHTRRVVDTINRTSPDLVAIVGDLVDGSVADLAPAAEPLRALRSRYGAYFVTGNHEYYSGAAPWVDHVRELGIHPLENARTELPSFDLAGINDLAGQTEHTGPDYERALDGRDPARAVVLMAHQPVTIQDTVRYGVDLQLSGHTHGGQMWPFTYVAEATNPTVAGLARYGDTQLYVTRGAGAWGPPVRLGAPPDVTVVELASRRA
ncbi:metallophosphoesterase [Streptomyces sp. NPDC056411]|uniref:metallophosphoesterase n=1 Tax=Streptomyces sp. NPDC056411 TaxID=3345813 RepID=UPI0035D58A59